LHATQIPNGYKCLQQSELLIEIIVPFMQSCYICCIEDEKRQIMQWFSEVVEMISWKSSRMPNTHWQKLICQFIELELFSTSIHWSYFHSSRINMFILYAHRKIIDIQWCDQGRAYRSNISFSILPKIHYIPSIVNRAIWLEKYS
jgi:hypothetical protein